MFGILKDAADFAGEAVGTTVGIATAPIAIALGISERAVKAALRAGCRTNREIREWVQDNWDE